MSILLCGIEVMDTFIGRRRELGLLDKQYRSSASAFIPIYGRRRVGKSELILQFIKDKPAIYFVAGRSTTRSQIQEFLRVAAKDLSKPFLSSVTVPDWKTALETVWSQWDRDEKLVLAIDEFQWAARAASDLPSVLQQLWDLDWGKSGKMNLILCGSFIGFMEREVLGKESPLFGRRTAQILLQPFSFPEASLFHSKYSLVDRARTHFICGGIPLYLQFFSPERSVEMNIRENLLEEYAPLFREADFLLREELREVENYYSILTTLASSEPTIRSIARNTGLDARNLPYYLQQLADLGYVTKKYPLTGRKPTARSVRYVVSDPLLQFWFRFVHPNRSYIIHAGAERAYHDVVAPNLDSYLGLRFEELCREALPFLYDKEKVGAAYQVGQYWDKGCQIDVVGYRDDGWTDLGECKWSPSISSPDVLRELDAKVSRYPNDRQATIQRRVFVRNKRKRSSSALAAAKWHTLEDIYMAGQKGSP